MVPIARSGRTRGARADESAEGGGARSPFSLTSGEGAGGGGDDRGSLVMSCVDASGGALAKDYAHLDRADLDDVVDLKRPHLTRVNARAIDEGAVEAVQVL